MSRFFVSCPLHFENELAKELRSFWFEMIDLDGLPTRSEFPELEILQGGVELETQDHLGFQINFFSKLANRVLLRIAKFEARYFDQFEKALEKVDLQKYLEKKLLKVKIESHKSRLNNEKNLLEATTKVLAKKQFQIKDDSSQTLFIRIEKDRVTLSLDTSGDHLHRRGYATFRGEAPLRETLAAYLVRKLSEQVSIDKSLTIIDPFAGSGTLLFEANSWNRPNLERDYTWLHFKNAPKLFKSETWKRNYRWFSAQSSPQCLAFDLDEKAIANLEKNKIDYQKTFSQETIDLTAETKDSLKIQLDRAKLRSQIWVLTNPPYGIRLADDNAKKILEKLEENIDGMVVIHPLNWKFNFKNLKPVESEDFSNQGLKLKLSIFSKMNTNINNRVDD